MKIIFLTRYYHPDDIRIWSGTLSRIYHKLKEKHDVKCMGGEMLAQVDIYRLGNFRGKPSDLRKYVRTMGELLSERIRQLKYDVVLFGDNYYVPYLNCGIPIVRISDITYQQFKDYLNVTDEEKIKQEIGMERQALQNYTHIIYPSEWIKQKTVEYYNIDPGKIDVVDYGANIPAPARYQIEIDMHLCNLLFIGKRWQKKGGCKVLGAYRKLKADGFPCTLTIIGSRPDTPVEADKDITIIPFLDKNKPEEMKRLDAILAGSHFLVLPTQYDAYGIVFCEASAYAVPSIAADVCGVGQPVREGKNGYLLSPDATADDYAEKIKSLFQDQEAYRKLRASSRREFETRLNWDTWAEQVGNILEQVVKQYHQNSHLSECTSVTPAVPTGLPSP